MRQDRGRNNRAQHVCVPPGGNSIPTKEGAAAKMEKPWHDAHSVHGPMEKKTSLPSYQGVSEKKAPMVIARLSSTKFWEQTMYVLFTTISAILRQCLMLGKYLCPERETNEEGNYRLENLQVGQESFLTSLYLAWPRFQYFLSTLLWTSYNF